MNGRVIKAILSLHGVLWTEDLVADLVAAETLCTCAPSSENPNPDCASFQSEQRMRRRMAAAWDDGMLSHSRGLGTCDNPYARDDA